MTTISRNRNLFVFILLLLTGHASGHALWIETASTGIIGQKQDVYIYYGEYAENQRDSVAHWFSDVKEVTVWLVSPGNKKTALATSAQATRLAASFIPDASGSYTILVDHAVKDIPGSTLYQFVSSASVSVGRVLPAAEQNTNSLSMYLPEGTVLKVNKPAAVQAAFKGKPSSDIIFSVVSPEGWVKTYPADAGGKLVFTPVWPGVYMIEAMHTERTKGEQNGKAYESIWRGATFLITVQK